MSSARDRRVQEKRAQRENQIRGWKRLGCDADTLIKKVMDHGKGGRLDKDEYEKFWVQMTVAAGASQFLGELIAKLMEVLQGKFSLRPDFVLPQKKKAPTDPQPELQQALLNTIAFMAQTMPSDKRRARTVHKDLESFKKNQAKYPFRINQAGQDTLKAVTKLVANMAGETTDVIASLLTSCGLLVDVADTTLADVVGHPTMPQEVFEGDCSNVFTFLKRKAQTSVDERQAILSKILFNITPCVKGTAKLNMIAAKTSLLAYLHMLKQFLSYWRIPGSRKEALTLADKAIRTLTEFYLWPEPYGGQTRELLDTLKKEKQAPGNEMFKRFAQETRVPEVDGYDADEDDNGLGQRARPVYYMIDSKSPESWLFAQQMSLELLKLDGPAAPIADDEEPPEAIAGLSPKVTAILLLNMMSTDIEITEEITSLMRGLSEDDVYELFDDAIGIITQALDGPLEEAQAVRTAGMKDIKTRMAEMAADNQETMAPVIILPDQLPKNFLPELPPLAHLAISTDIKYQMPTVEELEVLKKETIAAVQSGEYKWPRTPAFDKIVQIVQQFRELSDPEEPCSLRFVIAGGDALLHSVVCAHLAIRQEYPDLMKGFDLQFFIAPFAENAVSAFLARHDPWYRRHMYVPYRVQPFMLPKCSVPVELPPHLPHIDDVDFSVLPPGQFLRENVASYVREACVTIGLCVFKVEAWKEPQMREGLPDELIPFVQGVDIGVHAFAKTLMKKHDLKTLGEALASKEARHYHCPDVNIQIRRVDLTSSMAPNRAPKDEGLSCDRIRLSNVPVHGDKTFPADPRAKWLEMHVDPAAKNRVHNFQCKGQQHVGEAEITCTSLGDKFPLMIDGQQFGPFYRIRITRVEECKDGEFDLEQVEFPIRTFFPLDI